MTDNHIFIVAGQIIMIDQHSQNRLQRLQWRFVVGWAILSLAFVAWGLVKMTIDRTPTAMAGRANLDALMPWWVASTMAWVALSIMAWMLWRGIVRTRRESYGTVVMLILVVAIGARVAVLIGHEPTLSDDVYRYVMDGRNLAHGHNPYLDTPAERAGFPSDVILERPLSVLMGEIDALSIEERWSGEADLLPLINNPELHTIYLPTSQWVFAGTGLLIRENMSDPSNSTWMFRSVMVGFEVLAILLLIGALILRKQSPWWAALYAWHPLPLAELAGSGHQDSIGLAFMMLAMVLFLIAPRKIWGWTICLALAALVKPVVLPIAAFMLKDLSVRRFHHREHGEARDGKQKTENLKTEMREGDQFSFDSSHLRDSPWCILLSSLQNWKAWLLSVVIGALVCLAISAPLWFTHDGKPLDNLRETSTRFSTKWSHFGSVYESSLWAIRLVDPLEDPDLQWQKKDRQELQARGICLALVGIVCVIAFFCPAGVWRSSRAVLFAMVLFSSTSHPWYLLWALILLPVAFSPAVWVASLTLLLGYAQLGDVVEWETPTWVMWLAYVPIFVVLILDLARKVFFRHPT
ncbi:MAG: hypothetical protein O7G85_01000 [Planctomycetota bacterium]|nr:hypothetical protein [Planctomycetota bacterium]